MGLVYADVRLSNPAAAHPPAPVPARALVDSGSTFLGDEVLLGAVPMEDMDVVTQPLHRTLGPNPLNPNAPGAMAKGLPPRFKDQRDA